jgi:hypothetical protein
VVVSQGQHFGTVRGKLDKFSTLGILGGVPAGRTLRVTPMMKAGLSDHVWSVEELVSLLEPIPNAN